MDCLRVAIRSDTIRLDGFLKFAGAAGTGGEAKVLVQAGLVRVNGSRETHRGRQLAPGDRVELCDDEGRQAGAWVIAREEGPEAS